MTVRKTVEFDELSQAQNILKNGFSKGSLTIHELTILAKYYYSLGMSGNKLKKEIINFCKENSAGFNDIVHRQTIMDAMKRAKKYSLKLSNSVPITVSEMNTIRTLPMKYGKILFVMIVIAKYNKHNSNKNRKINNLDNSKYYCNMDMREVLGIAKMSMNEKELLDACKILAVKNKYIEPKEDKDYIYTVFCVDETSDTEIMITDMNNIISYFPAYCEKCGKNIKKTGTRQKYCTECWNEKQKEMSREAMRRKREKC